MILKNNEFFKKNQFDEQDLQNLCNIFLKIMIYWCSIGYSETERSSSNELKSNVQVTNFKANQKVFLYNSLSDK